MATANTRYLPALGWIPILALIAILFGPALNATAQDGQDEPHPEAETAKEEKPEGEQVVLSASELKQDPQAKGVPLDQLGPEPLDPMIAPTFEPDNSGCLLPALILEALDPASQRAVVRIADQPPRVVKPGAKIADTEVVVRLVREDVLVAVGPAGDGGKRPMLWIHPPEALGGKSRVQCFMPGPAGQ